MNEWIANVRHGPLFVAPQTVFIFLSAAHCQPATGKVCTQTESGNIDFPLSFACMMCQISALHTDTNAPLSVCGTQARGGVVYVQCTSVCQFSFKQRPRTLNIHLFSPPSDKTEAVKASSVSF